MRITDDRKTKLCTIIKHFTSYFDYNLDFGWTKIERKEERKKERKKRKKIETKLLPWPWFEPGTSSQSGRCSTNWAIKAVDMCAC